MLMQQISRRRGGGGRIFADIKKLSRRSGGGDRLKRVCEILCLGREIRLKKIKEIRLLTGFY